VTASRVARRRLRCGWAWDTIIGMTPTSDPPLTSRAVRRSRLFRSRPDALLVEEWVPNITLPPPPDTPLEEEDPAAQLVDEHGLPSFEDQPEEPEVPRAGPARLFVGMGQRGQPVAPLEADGDDDDDDNEFVYNEPDGFFVAELRLPRPKDSLPFRVSEGSVDDDEERSSEVLLDTAESSDPSISLPDLDLPFSVSLEAPDPLHLGAFGDEDEDEDEIDEDELDEDEDELDEDELDEDEDELDEDEIDALVGGGLPPLALHPSPAREPLHARQTDREQPSAPLGAPPPPIVPEIPGPDIEDEPEPRPAPEVWARPGGSAPAEPEPAPVVPDPAPPVRTGPVQVLRSRPFWTKDRPLKQSSPEPAPLFQPRQVPAPDPIRAKIFSWTNLGLLLAMLVIAVALWVLIRGG
jgi:hypothetical protein